MPALVAFGRRWRIGSDDFVFPGLTEAFFRFSWVVLGTLVFAINYPLQCQSREDERELTIYLTVLLGINVSTTLLCLVMAFISSRGAIMDPRPRRLIPKLLYIRLPLFLLEFVWTIIATVEVFRGYDLCHFINYVRVIVALAWAMILIVVVGLLVVFNPIREDEMEDGMLISRRNWSRTLSIFKFRQDVLMRAALDDIANLVASFFVDQNVVLSDIAAGLLLVVHSPHNEYPPTKADARPVPSWMTSSAALHFMHFATCVYGWPTYLMHNRSVSAYAALMKNVKCCGKMRCDQVLIVEDNCCLCHTASFSLSLKGRNVDLFFVSFRNRLYEVPFVVLADHDSRSIVITIRGSCSLIDLVTDLSLDDEVLSVDVDTDPVLAGDTTLDTADGSEVRVHRGMLRSARYVYDTIKKNSVLEDLFVLNPTYSLVVCGHSLGAGVASLLTLLLKQQYPSIHCFAFSPPGCVISENGQAEMEQHVMSLIGGDDVVPRISYQSMHKLRENVEMELRQTTKAKYEILIKGIFRLFFHSPWELHSDRGGRGGDEGSANGEDATDERGTDRLILDRPNGMGYGTHEETRNGGQVALEMEERIQLYTPGRTMYVFYEGDRKDDVVRSEWIDNKCLSEVKLTTSVFTDHLPINVVAMLQKLVGAQSGADAERVITVQPVGIEE